MLDWKTFDWTTRISTASRRLLRAADDVASPRQRRLMIAALTLLLAALGFVLYSDRGFWFPDAQQVEAEPESTPATNSTPAIVATVPERSIPVPVRHRKSANKSQSTESGSEPAPAESPGVSISATRTVLPPLEVEVVAGDAHRTAVPKDNEVQVELENGARPAATTESERLPAAGLETPAAERVAISPGAPQVVSHSVQPGYPLLARQMKVEGSVILQALIGKDGKIQNLSVVSGPPILAHAAEEAVRQWHFKPHYLEGEAVETQANITVNFTISTN